jgi:hypothetical protein
MSDLKHPPQPVIPASIAEALDKSAADLRAGRVEDARGFADALQSRLDEHRKHKVAARDR